MFELVQLGEKTYYLKNSTNIGIYKINDKDVYIIDSGNDKEAGKKILKVINEQEWNVIGIINTHSNADHIGGNKVIEERTNAKIYSNKIESCFNKYPILEPSFLYGGYPFKELQNKFLMAKATDNIIEVESNLPEGLEYINIFGHFFNMIGVKTSDNVFFLGDSLFSEELIDKYSLFFIYDVNSFLNTLDYLDTLEGVWYVPSHTPASNNIKQLIKLNRDKVNEIIDYIYDKCSKPITFEHLLKSIFDDYKLQMNVNQYVLIGSTIKSYLSYLKDNNKICYDFIDNEMLWRRI